MAFRKVRCNAARLSGWFAVCVLALVGATAHAQEMELIGPPSAAADERRGPLVREIEVEYAGPKSVSRSVIVSNMRTAVGQPYSQASIEEDVRNLYATGLFSNLRIYDEMTPDGVKVIVIVAPKPIVKEVVLVGWSRIKDRRLLKEVTTKVGETLDEQKIAADARKMEVLYQSKGFKDAKVSYTVDVTEETGRGVVTYTIDESGRQYIKKIEFSGNKAFTEKELTKVLKTKRRGFFSFLFGTGVVKDEEWREDLWKLREHYQNAGFLDMEITGVEFKEAGGDYVVPVIGVLEGTQFRVADVRIEGATVFSEDKLRSRMKLKSGSIFSPEMVQEDVKAVQDYYGTDGYVDARVITQREPALDAGKLNLVMMIREGEQAYVERIIIQGNDKTKDKVIRRELALLPGQLYDTVRAEASKKRLEGLDYFEKVEIRPEDTPIPGRKNMIVSVEEKRTGAFTFGAGYSTIDSILGFVEVSQGNFDIANWPSFVGAGQKFRLRLQYGARRQDYTISFVEPWFLDKKLSFGVDLFYKTASYFSTAYDEERWGSAIKFGRSLNEFLSARAVYRIQSIGVINVDPGSSVYIQAEEGRRLKSSMEFGLTWDQRDSVFLTRKGHKLDAFAEIAGGPFFGDTDIYKVGLEGVKYHTLPYDIILSFRGRLEVVDSYGDSDTVPIFDRLFAGGSDSIRGFQFRDIAPKDEGLEDAILNKRLTDAQVQKVSETLDEYDFNDEFSPGELDDLKDEVDDLDTWDDDEENSSDENRQGERPDDDDDDDDLRDLDDYDWEGTPIGGRTMAYGSVEATFPLIKNVRGAVFVDGGFVNEDSWDFDPSNYNMGAGLGLRLNLPIGPLRFDYGFPIVRSDEFIDSDGQFHFSVGYQFQ